MDKRFSSVKEAIMFNSAFPSTHPKLEEKILGEQRKSKPPSLPLKDILPRNSTENFFISQNLWIQHEAIQAINNLVRLGAKFRERPNNERGGRIKILRYRWN